MIHCPVPQAHVSTRAACRASRRRERLTGPRGPPVDVGDGWTLSHANQPASLSLQWWSALDIRFSIA